MHLLITCAVIVTHNHRDHTGGILNIVRTWSRERKFGRIYLIGNKTEESLKLARFLRQECYAKRMKVNQARFLSKGSRFSLPAIEGRVQVVFLSPTVIETILEKNANEASGVIRVGCRGKDVLFCGDSTRAIWERIRSEFGKPLKCEAVAVPHHGGHMSDSSSGDDGEFFFTEAVAASVAIFSFGTSNKYSHPRPEVVCAAREKGNCGTILCTQAHPKLNSPPYAVDEKNGLFPPTPFSRSYWDQSLESGTGRRQHYACAGSITLRIGPRGAEWGHRKHDPDPICGFESIPQFKQAVQKVLAGRSLPELPPCHQDTCF